MNSQLSPLQRDLLDRFFRLEKGFFLTGGGALAGFHLGHRQTHDLDLFVTSDRLQEGEAALRESARQLGATLESIRTSPEFRRWLVRRGEESVIVDLVLDRTPQGQPQKQKFGEIIVDPVSEILANKLCTLLSRAEVRDLVDVLAIERAGHKVESAVDLAARKDGGLTPGQLAWVLSEIELSDDADIPGGVSPAELRAFLSDLQNRLTRLAYPI